MKLGARILSTMAFAFFLVPALLADDTPNPAATPSKDDSANSAAAPAASALPEPAGRTLFPFPALFSRQGSAGVGRGTDSEKHGRQSGGEGDATPKVELFVGYSYWRAVPETTSNRIYGMNGASASVAYNFNRHIGLVVDVAGFKVDSLQFTGLGAGYSPSRVVDADGSVLTFLIGPRVSFRNHSRLTPFLQILGGAAQADYATVTGCAAPVYACVPLPRDTAFAMTAGGGLDLRLNRRIALRLLQAEFLYTRFSDPAYNEQPGWQSNVRLSTGIVFRFGGNPAPPPANRSPIASCSEDRSMVYLGSDDAVAVTATASDPDNDPLTYTWTATGGRVDGTGSQIRWLSAGTTVGTYTVTLHVDDGRGGFASCTADMRVEARPKHPPTITCVANPNSVFAGEVSHITCNANSPDGNPLTYTWRANAGRITGNGPNGDFDTTGLSPDAYTITTRVDDGQGGAADASVIVTVKPVPPQPQASKINECAFGKALSTRIDNVCKRILDDVALRLQNEPRATAVIIGYSDPKERRPDKIAGDRGANAVKYLGEKGVDASRVSTRTGAGQAGATNNRRIDVIYVPEGATY